MQALMGTYPDAVAYDAGGFAVHALLPPDDAYDIRLGRAALLWYTEEESINDPGVYAFASIDVEE